MTVPLREMSKGIMFKRKGDGTSILIDLLQKIKNFKGKNIK